LNRVEAGNAPRGHGVPQTNSVSTFAREPPSQFNSAD
jgi:hypothetical protein